MDKVLYFQGWILYYNGARGMVKCRRKGSECHVREFGLSELRGEVSWNEIEKKNLGAACIDSSQCFAWQRCGICRHLG